MARKPKNIERQLREAILSSELSRYRLSQMTGITEAQLSLFVNGHRGLNLTTAAKLAKVFRMELAQIDER